MRLTLARVRAAPARQVAIDAVLADSQIAALACNFASARQNKTPQQWPECSIRCKKVHSSLLRRIVSARVLMKLARDTFGQLASFAFSETLANVQTCARH